MYREAFVAKDEQHELATELFHAERDRAVMELQVRFDVNQRQKEIDALEQKNRLQNSEIQNRNLQKIIAILAILIAIAVAATTFILYRRVRRSNQRLRKSNRQLEHKSTHDQLTGLLNRRAFEELMKNLSVYSPTSADAKPLPSILALLDIDHFKHINDTHGHSVGDLVLVELGMRLQGILREKDMVIRWGGEEFMIYLHGIPVERISQAMNRALVVIGASKFHHEGRDIPVTVSIGFIQMPLPCEGGPRLSWEKAMHFCDEALYMAKNGGRNQAIGVRLVQEGPDEINLIDQIDLPAAIERNLVQLQTIAGPAQ
jgi:diguanylate cyclase (GGDEF)-like protein